MKHYTEPNWLKIEHEVWNFRRMLLEWVSLPNQKRLSPQTQEYVAQLSSALYELAVAIHEKKLPSFEVNVWEQLSMTFPTPDENQKRNSPPEGEDIPF